jgi:hypothetical protein
VIRPGDREVAHPHERVRLLNLLSANLDEAKEFPNASRRLLLLTLTITCSGAGRIDYLRAVRPSDRQRARDLGVPCATDSSLISRPSR